MTPPSWLSLEEAIFRLMYRPGPWVCAEAPEVETFTVISARGEFKFSLPAADINAAVRVAAKRCARIAGFGGNFEVRHRGVARLITVTVNSLECHD